MTHTGPMPESAGDFDGWKQSKHKCGACGETKVEYRIWESSCGGYEDYQYRCNGCGQSWWVEGIDA